MYTYPVTLEHDPDTGSVMVGFPDLPWVHSVGDDEGEALLNAVDALETALDVCIRSRETFPEPGKIKKGAVTVMLGVQAAAKATLHNEMVRQGVRKAELARRLGLHMPQVDRLLDIRHSSRLEALEAAYKALGKQLEIRAA